MSLAENKTERFKKRLEERFVIAPSDIDSIMQVLKLEGYEEIAYDNPGVRNIHFTSPQLVAPKGGYVRLRQYVPTDSLSRSSFILGNKENWLLEVKLNEGEKERMNLRVSEAIHLLNDDRNTLFRLLPTSERLLCDFSSNLVPIASSQWARSHFIHHKSQLRATVDEGLQYFGFRPGERTAHFMGGQVKSKFELKNTNPIFDIEKDKLLEEIQRVAKLEPITNNWHEMQMRERYAKKFL